MSISSLPNGTPASSGEIPILNFDRLETVNRRHREFMTFAKTLNYEAVLVQRPQNFSWLTAGGDNTRHGNSKEPIAAILMTTDARVVLCNNVDSPQIFEQDLLGLGFQLKERHWTEDLAVLRADICRGRRVLNDLDTTFDEGEERKPAVDYFRFFRMQLNSHERNDLRGLASDVRHAVEATGRNFELGSSEAEIAAHLSHRLLKRNVQVDRMQIVSDSHVWRYRTWSHSNARPEKYCVISATGRRNGLHVGCSRTICLQTPDSEFENEFQLATLVHATGLHFSRHDWSVQETWKRVARIYEKFSIPDEWYGVQQGSLIGYSPNESAISSLSDHIFQAGQAIHWQLGVRNAFVGDTMIVHDGDPEILTCSENWPQLGVKIKSESIMRPLYLIRE